ncbi:MAG: HAMP domain-containing protein [Candidatus Firestonebacteria bacterium]|nr:HAMP domain-containing protein [Candidatus Firestonebacteria bacterium]
MMPSTRKTDEAGLTRALPRRKKRRISLGVKFTFLLLLAIGIMMTLTSWLTYRQQQRSLRDEVLQRGATVARSLASSAAEAVLNDLVCAALIHETMPPEEDFSSLSVFSLEAVIRSLAEDVSPGAAGAAKITRNAGIVEVLMVDTNNIIVSADEISKVSRPYQSPAGMAPYKDEPILIQEYLHAKYGSCFDIAVPILVNRAGTSSGKQIGVVHLSMSQALVDSIAKQATYKLLLVTGVLMFFGMLGALVLSHYLTQPINDLVGGVLAIAGGDLNQEIRVTRTDELGDLTNAFNEMAASLREKELIKGAFSTYVSTQVMEQVLKDPSKLALGGARKRVSVVFTDIRGFTSMSETMQPEEVVSIINVYLSLQTEIVIRNDGMLDKFVGDCVMAVYGLPFAKDDDALRAVRTAVEIQAAILKLNAARAKENLKTITIGIGVNTGEVVAGNMGSSQKMDYTVIGDSVNLAARLEANAEGGTVLISESTYAEVKDFVEADKLAPIPVKGKKDKVTVYSVKSMKA